MANDLDPEAESAFQEFLRSEAPAGYDASTADARHIWKAAWLAIQRPIATAPATTTPTNAAPVVDENAIRKLVNEYRHACDMVQGHAVPQWRALVNYLNTLMNAGVKDTARVEAIERAIQEGGAVWFLPSGEENRFVQVRKPGECLNFPTVPGLRAAIDAAFLGRPPKTPSTEKP